jgi:hypothetical protein
MMESVDEREKSLGIPKRKRRYTMIEQGPHRPSPSTTLTFQTSFPQQTHAPLEAMRATLERPFIQLCGFDVSFLELFSFAIEASDLGLPNHTDEERVLFDELRRRAKVRPPPTLPPPPLLPTSGVLR